MLTTTDHIEIHETLARHGFISDDNELDRLDELFTPDALYDMTASGMGAFEGIEVIRAAAAPMATSGRSPLAHYVTNILITSIDGDEASVRSKGLMIMPDGAIYRSEERRVGKACVRRCRSRW